MTLVLATAFGLAASGGALAGAAAKSGCAYGHHGTEAKAEGYGADKAAAAQSPLPSSTAPVAIIAPKADKPT